MATPGRSHRRGTGRVGSYGPSADAVLDLSGGLISRLLSGLARTGHDAHFDGAGAIVDRVGLLGVDPDPVGDGPGCAGGEVGGRDLHRAQVVHSGALPVELDVTPGTC